MFLQTFFKRNYKHIGGLNMGSWVKNTYLLSLHYQSSPSRHNVILMQDRSFIWPCLILPSLHLLVSSPRPSLHQSHSQRRRSPHRPVAPLLAKCHMPRRQRAHRTRRQASITGRDPAPTSIPRPQGPDERERSIHPCTINLAPT
jgi:hypothetical protein